MPRSVVAVLADGEMRGTALLVDVEGRRLVGRVQLGYQPVIELDLLNRQLLVVCSADGGGAGTELVAYGLDDLAIRWRVPLADRLLMKISTLPNVLASVDGLYVLTQHYRILRPGDAYAPGNGRWWFEVRDARSGAHLRDVDLPACGVGQFFQSKPHEVFVTCTHGMSRLIETDTWSVVQQHATSSAFRLWGLTPSGDHFIGVTHDLWVLTFEVRSGRQIAASHFADTALPIVPFFDRLAMSSSGSEIWVPLARPSYESRPGDQLVALNLTTGARTDHAVRTLGGPAWAADRVLYVDDGSLRVLGSGESIDLATPHRVTTWRIDGGD